MLTLKSEHPMHRSVFVCALILATAAALSSSLPAQQQPAQPAASDQYQGTSNPPPNDTITNEAPPLPAVAPELKPSPSQPASPSPAQPLYNQPAQAAQPALPQPAPAPQAYANGLADGTDNGIVQVAPDPTSLPGQPRLTQRPAAYDPDGDIVHPAPLGPGQVRDGTTIRVRLLQRLSTSDSQDGEAFRTRVASDVYQGGQVLIPAGAEIDGSVMNVSSGNLGGHGSMSLDPDMVILPDGSRFRLYAQVTGTPGSHTRVGSEGAINPDSRLKRDGLEYGGAVGAGVVTGAVLGGPAGALAGSIVGASLVTVHLLVNHPQATLDEGTVLLFTLTENLNLIPAVPVAN